MDKDQIIGYRLVPITRGSGGSGGSFSTACMMDDFVTGKNISTSGGGSEVISKATHDLLANDDQVRSLISSKQED